MSRRKLTPEERLLAQLKRGAAWRPWPGFALVWAAYPHEPESDVGWQEMSQLMAQMSWNSGRPSAKVIVAIVVVLQHWPEVTLDAKGRRLMAGLWLDNLWCSTPEELMRIANGTFHSETLTEAEAAVLGRLRAMVEALETPA